MRTADSYGTGKLNGKSELLLVGVAQGYRHMLIRGLAMGHGIKQACSGSS